MAGNKLRAQTRPRPAPVPRATRIAVIGAFCLLAAGGFAAHGLWTGPAPLQAWLTSGFLFVVAAGGIWVAFKQA